MVGPLKQLIPEFKAIEKRIETVIFAKFGIALPLDPCIKHADLRLLRTEQRDLTSAAGDNWNGLDEFEPLAETIYGQSPEDAAYDWLDRYKALTTHPDEVADGCCATCRPYYGVGGHHSSPMAWERGVCPSCGNDDIPF